MKHFLQFLALIIILTYSYSTVAQRISWNAGNNQESVSSVSQNGFVVKLGINAVDIQKVKTENGNFAQLRIEGFGKNLDYGKPELPVYKRLFELPQGSDYEIVVLSKQMRNIDLGDYGVEEYIYPCQTSVPKIENPEIVFQYDQATYLQNQFYQNDLVKIIPLGRMRSTDIARLEISPVQYNPITNQLQIVEALVIEIKIKLSNLNQLKSDKQRFYSPYFQTLTNRLINPQAYSSVSKTSSNSVFPLKYVIVADSNFRQALQPFIRWKEKKGFKVIEAYKQNPAVGSTTSSIKAYLQGLYNAATINDPAPSYVLLVGDVAQMPSFSGQTGGGHVTDLYYCEFTNDDFPEIMYGRFSANDTVELNAQIEKTLEYEQFTMPDPSFLGKSVLIAGYDASYGPLYGDGQVNYGTNSYFNSSNNTTCHAYLYANGSYNKDLEIRQQIDSGVSIANYTAHGSPQGWADPAFNVSHVAAMTNQSKYPLMVGNACITNKFNDAVCFGEALLRAKNKGAIGYIGATNNTYWDEDYYWAVGFKAISTNPIYVASGAGLYDLIYHTHNEAFSDWAMSSSQYVAAGNLAVTQGGSSSRYYWELYHILGDPSLMTYLKVPDTITATYVPFIQLGWTSYQVNTVPHALVALSQNDTLISSALADSNGLAILYLDSFVNTGSINLTITAQNYAPYFTTLYSGMPTVPYVVSYHAIIDDSLGNVNQIADQGESIKLDVQFINLTNIMAGAASVVLQSTDNQIVITDSVEYLGAFQAFDSLFFDDAFSLQIVNNAVNQHGVHCNLQVTDTSGGVWNSTLDFMIHAPQIEIANCQIFDNVLGNNNGLIEAGETIEMHVKINNLGLNDAQNVSCTLSAIGTWASVSGNPIFNLLKVDSSAIAIFTITFDNQLTTGNYIDFDFHFVSQAYSGSKSFPQVVGEVDEDFESGDFSKFIWNSVNNKPWLIDTINYFEGLNSARSFDPLLDNETSGLWVSMSVLTDDSIHFYRKVSSESGYDNLTFYIDGTKKDEWSGLLNWQKMSYPVSAGYHTFKWEYTKDVGIATNQDAAWVDYIKFPPTDAWSSVECLDEALINEIHLYPNPAVDQVTVDFTLTANQEIVSTLYNQLGQAISTPINHGLFTEGKHSLVLSLKNLSAGVYFVRIQTADQFYFSKLIVE